MVVALTVRDCYEAFVVYSFLTLILEHAGGDYNCIEQIKHLPPVMLCVTSDMLSILVL